MKQTTIFLVIGMIGVFSMLLAPSLVNMPADARISPQCQQTQSGQTSSGPCQGNSENSPNKQQQNVNPAGKAPRGQN